MSATAEPIAPRTLAQIEAAAEAAHPQTAPEPKMAQYGEGRLKGDAKTAYHADHRTWRESDDARREAVYATRDRLWAEEAPLREREWSESPYGEHEVAQDALAGEIR